MKAVVLLSAGYNPATGNPAPPAAELCALRLAADAGAETVGLHAGPQADAVRPALGHGVSRIRHLQVPAHSDVLPALADEISRIGPDLVLAGNRATGGGDTGLLPYLLAKALGWPILSDAVRLSDPFSYAELAEAVEAWGFRLSQEVGEFLSRPEVARRWFGEEFLPVVRMARRAEVRPDITDDAELYMWVAGERYRLVRRHIWDDEIIEELREQSQHRRR